jgi:hypothetical protein
MSKHQFSLPLTLKTDINGEEYMIGSADLPVMVNMRETTFLVFFPEEGKDAGTLMIRPRTLVPRSPPVNLSEKE